MSGAKGLAAAVALACLISSPRRAGGEEAGAGKGESPADTAATPLAITTGDLPDGMVGVAYLGELSAEGGRPPYHWKSPGGLPPGLSLDAGSPALKGTPESAGDFEFSLRVTDGDGASERRAYSIRVMADPAASAPPRESPPLTIITADLPAGRLGREYSATIKAEGGVPPYLWMVSSGSLPRGIALSGGAGPDSSPGPPAGAGAAAAATVYVTSAGGKYHWEGCPRLREGPRPLLLAEAKKRYELCAACAPQGEYGLAWGGRESAVEGVPLMDGEYRFSVTVRDKEGGSATAEYSIEIGTVRVYITTGSLPGATIGEEYKYGLEAVGGVLPYWWQVEAGMIPRGLSLDPVAGVISGVPEGDSTTWAEGVRTDIEPGLFRVRVTDGVGSRDRAEFRLRVVERAKPPAGGETTPTPAPLVLGEGSAPAEGGEGDAETFVEDGEEDEEEDEEKVVVVTDSVPPARVENEYSVFLEASGGSPPYTWSHQGTVPAGLSLDSSTGELQGEPTEAGASVLSVRAGDSLMRASEVKEIPVEVKDALGPVTGLLAAASDGKVGLAWANPADPDFREVMIVRSPLGEPADSGDGEIAYRGSGENAVDDGGLENGTEYYYAAFAVDAHGYESVAVEGSRASAKPMEVTLTGEYDPFVDEVVSFGPLTPGGFGSAYVPNNVLGPPFYDFSAPAQTCAGYVVSLHARKNDDGGATAPYGGSITLRFSDNIVVNGEGADFTVFGNGFYISLNPERMWIEPAVVEVSQDGSSYFRFPINYVDHGDPTNPYSYSAGFAGVRLTKSYMIADTVDPSRSGGDQFDLDAITGKDLRWISHVRLTATGDGWLVDPDGDPVRHVEEMEALSGKDKSGFDLDAIAAIHY